LRVDHIGLWVRELEVMRDFYVGMLGGEPGPLYHNPATGFSSCFVSFEGGMRLELMRQAAVPSEGSGLDEAVGRGHLALAVADEPAVVANTARLAHSGCVVQSPPRRTGDGYFESVVLDPEGNRIELVVR
jgi:lactoylglutathione lyase